MARVEIKLNVQLTYLLPLYDIQVMTISLPYPRPLKESCPTVSARSKHRSTPELWPAPWPACVPGPPERAPRRSTARTCLGATAGWLPRTRPAELHQTSRTAPSSSGCASLLVMSANTYHLYKAWYSPSGFRVNEVPMHRGSGSV